MSFTPGCTTRTSSALSQRAWLEMSRSFGASTTADLTRVWATAAPCSSIARAPYCRENMRPALCVAPRHRCASTRNLVTPLINSRACRTPCVVTDVGDSALIVGETGTVVPPGDPQALAEAWRKLIAAGPVVRHCLGLAARRRIQQHFALPAIVERYQAIYGKLAAGTVQNVPSPGLSQCAQ